mgnify:CR=1 FL=1
MAIANNTVCLWFDKEAEEAANFYVSVFPGSQVDAVCRASGDYPAGKTGEVLTVHFTLARIACVGLNGGQAFRHSPRATWRVMPLSGLPRRIGRKRGC